MNNILINQKFSLYTKACEVQKVDSDMALAIIALLVVHIATFNAMNAAAHTRMMGVLAA